MRHLLSYFNQTCQFRPISQPDNQHHGWHERCCLLRNRFSVFLDKAVPHQAETATFLASYSRLSRKGQDMKRTPTLIASIILTLSLLTWNTAMAQTEGPAPVQASGEVGLPLPLSFALFDCAPSVVYTNGSGANMIKFCTTTAGNMGGFESPQNFNHFDPMNGTGDSGISLASDGYVLCSALGVHGSNPSEYNEVGWGPSTWSQPNGPSALPMIVTRLTTDGKFQLKHHFTWDVLRKEVVITMTLQNISSSPIASVQLARYFDANIDNDKADDRYDRDADSVWARDTGGHGLMLTALTFAQPHTTAVERFIDWEPYFVGVPGTARTCTPLSRPVPTAPGNYVGRLTYQFGTIPAGATRIVKVLYRRI